MTNSATYERDEAVVAALRALADLFAAVPGLPVVLVYPLQELREALRPYGEPRKVKAAAIVLSAVCQTTIRNNGL